MIGNSRVGIGCLLQYGFISLSQPVIILTVQDFLEILWDSAKCLQSPNSISPKRWPPNCALPPGLLSNQRVRTNRTYIFFFYLQPCVQFKGSRWYQNSCSLVETGHQFLPCHKISRTILAIRLYLSHSNRSSRWAPSKIGVAKLNN